MTATRGRREKNRPPPAEWPAFSREYRKAYGARPLFIAVDGVAIPGRGARRKIDSSAYMVRVRACALREAGHWGEPYIFFIAPKVVGWLAALVDGRRLRGGCSGGEALIEDGEAARPETIRHLEDQGVDAGVAREFASNLRVWPKQRVREAAEALERMFYRHSGWDPALLRENKARAAQQRAASTDAERDKRLSGLCSLEKERLLLSLIKTGDGNGARMLLNEMLGAMFLSSPALPVLRARAIELMGYLTRAAVEDNPLLEPLLGRNLLWMEKLIKARDFDEISRVLPAALDDFMEGIYMRGFNCYSAKVGRMLDFISRNWNKRVTVGQAADAAGLSESRASHLLRSETGRTLLQHVMRIRIHKAQDMLRRSNKGCAEIAGELGFCDQSHFTRHFRRIAGMSPMQFRKLRDIAGNAS